MNQRGCILSANDLIKATVWKSPIPERKDIEFFDAVCDLIRDDVFCGVPLNRIIQPDISIEWNKTISHRQSRGHILASFRVLYSLFLREFLRKVKRSSNKTDFSFPENRIAIQFPSNETRLRDLWEPILNRLGFDQTVIIVNNNNIRKQLSMEIPILSLESMDFDWSTCRNWILKRIFRWWRELRKLSKIYNLASSAAAIIINILISATINIAKSKEALLICKPRVWFSVWDQGTDYGGSISLLANQLNIQTFTCVHGAFGRYSAHGFTNLNAKYVFAWGNIQRDLFLEAGIEEDRIIVTGCQRLGLDKYHSHDNSFEAVQFPDERQEPLRLWEKGSPFLLPPCDTYLYLFEISR